MPGKKVGVRKFPSVAVFGIHPHDRSIDRGMNKVTIEMWARYPTLLEDHGRKGKVPILFGPGEMKSAIDREGGKLVCVMLDQEFYATEQPDDRVIGVGESLPDANEEKYFYALLHVPEELVEVRLAIVNPADDALGNIIVTASARRFNYRPLVKP